MKKQTTKKPTPKTPPTADKELKAEIKYLDAENARLSDVLTAIQTRHSRLLLYDNLTLPNARQIGVNIDAIISYAFGDLTEAQMNKKVKFISGKNGK